MTNFKIITNTRFTANIDFYKRTYYVLKKSNGKVKISSVLNGSVLFDNLDPNEILIDGNPMMNIQELQDVVYNQSCYCDPENDDDNYKIFDKTFDKTFE
ncbi:hypothetical protein [Chryseobacterium sp.]|uniref:hypothetical protein n=1 Tax=Chryseobacterium sp. TaxID=1871047 RepID=UPI0035AE1E54